MKTSKVRKSFRNFILSRIARCHQDQEYLDVKIQTTSEETPVFAHKFILASLCPLLHEALENQMDEDQALILMPDFDLKVIEKFVFLSYGLLNPEALEPQERQEILDLAHIFGIKFEPIVNQQETLTLEEEVTTEDVERLLNAVVNEQQILSIEKPPQPQGPQPSLVIQDNLQLVINCPELGCNHKFTEEKDLAFHQQACHQRPLTFYCSLCQKTFSKETSLRHHKIAAHHAGTKIKLTCHKCNGQFTGKSALARHVANCDGKTTLDCHICGKVYARKDNLVNHLARHSGVQLKCDHCQKTFRTSNDLYKHKKRLHPAECGLKSAYVVNCPDCGRKFTDKGRAYKDHLAYHKGIKNYECHYCERKFATASSLRDHSAQHSGLSTHACKICRKEFKRVQNIRQHLMWTHKLSEENAVRNNIERLFLTGVDKLRALKEFEDNMILADGQQKNS